MVESIGVGNLKILERTSNVDQEKSIDSAEGIFYVFTADCGLLLKHILEGIKIDGLEMNDIELRKAAMQSGSYAFWDDPREDVYTLEDGEPL